MDRVIIIRYGELFLKGKNRNFFENLLIRRIKDKMNDIKCKTFFGRGRYEISEYDLQDEQKIIDRLLTIFGIQSFSIAYKVKPDFDAISDLAINIAKKQGSFRVNVHRANKRFPMTSIEAATELGGRILDANPNLKVDLHNPDFTINVDIRETAVYVYSDKIAAAGGMPTGSAGKGLLMLSGGIDSPVAGYMMAKRGLCMDAIHFHSYPYTSEQAKDKVIELAKALSIYTTPINLILVPFTKIQEAIHQCCDPNYMITIMRRFMMQLAERVAASRHCGCIINGESLGQVASQTLESINTTNAMVKFMPVFRPLIGMDKQEIIEISYKINTYELSIQPFEDCCTVFLPENPVTRPSLENAMREHLKIKNADELVEEAFSNIEVIKIS